MKTLLSAVISCIFLLGIVLLPVTHADDERPEHFKGEPAETLEQALANFREYNDKLAEVLARDELTAKDLYEVHQLTYTLENALERIRDEYEGLAETLEEVHIASEHNDNETVKSRGQAYLDAADKLVD